MTEQLFRLDSAREDVVKYAEQGGFQRMFEIAPRHFLEGRGTNLTSPDSLSLQDHLDRNIPNHGLDNRGNPIRLQADYQKQDSELNGPDGDKSYRWRLGVQRALKRAAPFASIGAFGNPRRNHKGNSIKYMELLMDEADYSNVVSFRHGVGGVMGEDSNFDQVQANLTYAQQFYKPIILTIGAMWRDENKKFHSMTDGQAHATLHHAFNSGVEIAGVYLRSHAYRLLQEKPERLAVTWSEDGLSGYLKDCLARTQASILTLTTGATP